MQDGERADDFVGEAARVYEQVRVHAVANLNLIDSERIALTRTFVPVSVYPYTRIRQIWETREEVPSRKLDFPETLVSYSYNYNRRCVCRAEKYCVTYGSLLLRPMSVSIVREENGRGPGKKMQHGQWKRNSVECTILLQIADLYEYRS